MNEQSYVKIKTQRPDSGKLYQKFKELGFEQLTVIQKKACPKILQKKDMLVIAPTGSGKTETAVIPIFSLVRNVKKNGMIKVLYITPLRALNRDVFRRIEKYAKHDKLDIKIRHGDTTQSERKKIANNPPDVLITTPETLVMLLTQEKILNALKEIEWIVIDEVHELLSSKRGAQLGISLERLQFNSIFEITRIGLSASIGNPNTAAKFIAGTKRKCEIVRDSSVRKYDVDVKYVNGTITDVVDFIIEYTSKLGKETVLLFTNTRGEAEFLASVLKEKSDISIEMHHGSLSKEVREETERKLREGKPQIVVCTSSLELGLDIGSIQQVIHYGSPRQVSKLVQRIGRSRHKKNSSAKGIIIANNFDDEYEAKAILDRVKINLIEEQKIHSNSFDVLGHHLVGLVLQNVSSVTVSLAWKIIVGAYSFREVKINEIVDVLELLNSTGIIWFERDKMRFSSTSRTFRYHYENLSTIPNILKFRVFDRIAKKTIGYLDQKFVGDYGQQGNVFVLKGTKWSILNVDEKSLIINVEPFRTQGTVVPYWEGENIPIDQDTASLVGKLRKNVQKGNVTLANNIISSIDIKIPDDNTLVIESVKAYGLIIHSCFGTKINLTLSVLLSSLLLSILDQVVEARSDAYRIALKSPVYISKDVVFDILRDDYDLFDVIASSLSGTYNINWRVWNIAKKFGVIRRDMIYQQKEARFLYERFKHTPLVKEAIRELYHDKYDIAGLETILKKIQNEQIILVYNDAPRFSKLAEPILDRATKYYSATSDIDEKLLELVKRRLHKTKHRLICARCGIWEMTYATNEIKSVKPCTHCNSKQITATFLSDKDLSKIIKDKHSGEKLSEENENKFKKAWKIASLIENFGTTAILVLSGYGIGADTAGRILRNMISEQDVYKQIYQAERQYVMTRGFWD